jgi:hypothetical protein
MMFAQPVLSAPPLIRAGSPWAARLQRWMPKNLGAKLYALLLVAALPLCAVDVFQAVEGLKNSHNIAEEFPTYVLAIQRDAQFKEFVNGVSDALDSGSLSRKAVQAAFCIDVRSEIFRRALESAFPYPHALAAGMDDATLLCRCEAITAGEMRRSAAPELNRGKALTRVGMGRCQGRLCGPPAAEVLAAAMGCDIAEIGRLRGQMPVKPVVLR